ncbi:putative glycerophosphoryl diester phosphodiesterase 1 [Aureliella helgolandensis]|uniref:Putative glycerophosphoryl diester phosphodiesterase 1 n=2 Tax=Aureliella helgolandensis TaxID=2527968 RepID=A0A518GDA1_9BACT|nr:putative glycerophosphoryl diester phosphodiesterase 1 [Aureliella helgolandensis]
MIVGHRGASYDAPENTIAAFQEAWKQHADGVEGDFYLTTDQEIVCIHDKDTLRTGGKKLSVAGSTLAKLRSLEYGSWKNAKFAGEPLPTFQEVWKSIPADKWFIIELKVGPEIVPVLKQQIDALAIPHERLLVIAFNTDTVAKTKQLLPDVRTHWLTGYKADADTGEFTPTAAQIAKTLQACHADGLGTQGNRDVVNAAFIDQLKRAGMREFHVWTIDAPEDAKYFQKLGAVGITTNRPAFIRESLGLE